MPQNKKHNSPFNQVPGLEIPIPEEGDFENIKFPVVRISMALTCACPYLPMSLPQSIEENEPVISDAIENGQPVLLLAQDPGKYEAGKSKGLKRVGVWARIVRVQSPQGDDDFMQLLCISGPRVAVQRFVKVKGRLCAVAEKQDWILPDTEEGELQAAAFFHELIERYDQVHELEQAKSPSAHELFGTCDEYQFVSSLLFNLSVNPIAKHDIINRRYLQEVIEDILFHLSKLRQLLEIRRDINSKVNQVLTDVQRENFIQHQIDMLQKEIGHGAGSDIENLRKRGDNKKWTDDTKEHFKRELAKLQRLSPTTPDYSIQYSYLDSFLNLPWDNTKDTDISLDRIENQLNEDHFGLERVKERILEQMAVAKLRNDNKSPILCLVGPPGVGKTSLGKSIAAAMDREYGRVAFGGLHDEAEIRGHRRTYIGAMPGRIIAALQKMEYSNPVIVLDEIDKIGKDYKGDPSTALLEVLDPEQNSKFHDNYLDADYDLSRILFIATANSLETISGPLRDRMEIISIPGYIAAEKIEIAKRHLLPKQLEANGMKDEEIRLTDDALEYIIEYYTRESGVRKLEKTIGKLLRKIAVKKVRNQDFPKVIDKKIAGELLGKEEFNPDMYENNDSIGVVTGLAWTQVGGEILFIESTVTDGSGKLTLTGNLGDVMKESATLAFQFLKANASLIGLEQSVLDKHDVHIHVPEGAIPKDGPSAGITITTSLASSLTGRKVRSKLAMTGEITLRGKVLPVGGIREKIIAAKRAGIEEIILSKENEKDIAEIKAEYIDGLRFTFVDHISQVLDRALL
ncbi:MAG: endopeptidase La [Muribaculaceae bacterium]|nr:endopeptidase La [Muribaculaceae bacterium]